MQQASIATNEIPNIVLLVDEDPDTLGMYSAFFESSGLWAATSTDPAEAIDAVRELRPDLIVTEIRFAGAPVGADFVHTLKHDEDTKNIPVIVVSSLPADGTLRGSADEADSWLLKPIDPQALLTVTRRLVDRGRELRGRAQRAAAKSVELTGRASAATNLAVDLVQKAQATMRRCPECAQTLDWIECGRLGEVTYDYYHWCQAGCGLYCFERTALKWVRLA